MKQHIQMWQLQIKWSAANTLLEQTTILSSTVHDHSIKADYQTFSQDNNPTSNEKTIPVNNMCSDLKLILSNVSLALDCSCLLPVTLLMRPENEILSCSDFETRQSFINLCMVSQFVKGIFLN